MLIKGHFFLGGGERNVDSRYSRSRRLHPLPRAATIASHVLFNVTCV